jgi:hypothetical protein
MAKLRSAFSVVARMARVNGEVLLLIARSFQSRWLIFVYVVFFEDEILIVKTSTPSESIHR